MISLEIDSLATSEHENLLRDFDVNRNESTSWDKLFPGDTETVVPVLYKHTNLKKPFSNISAYDDTSTIMTAFSARRYIALDAPFDLYLNKYVTNFQKPTTFFFNTDTTTKNKRYRFCSVWQSRFDSAITFNRMPSTDFIMFNCLMKGKVRIATSDTIKSVIFSSCSILNGLSLNELINGTVPIDSYDMLGAGYKKAQKFSGDLHFINCHLKGNFDLSGSNFISGAVILENTNLPDTLDFSDSKLSNSVNLTTAFSNLSKEKCEINLYNTNIDKINLLYNNFHLFFADSVKNDVLQMDNINSTYQALLNNFQQRGYSESYRKLDIEFKDWLSENNWLLKFSSLWWNYGYEKWRIIPEIFILLLIFTTINYFVYQKLIETYYVKSLVLKSGHFTSKVSAVLNKFLTVFFYSGLIFFQLGFDLEKIDFKNWKYVSLILFQYAIGLVCIGFVAHWIL